MSDLKCVLNVKGACKVFVDAGGVGAVAEACEMVSGGGGAVWVPIGRAKVEWEGRGWVKEFNAAIAISSLLDKVSTVGSYEIPTDDWGESSAWLSNVPSLSAWEANQTEGSFHNVLHGLFVCLAEPVWRRGLGKDLLAALDGGLSGVFLRLPLASLVREGEIRAGLWPRNNEGLRDQVLNYGEVPFCRGMRDRDLMCVRMASRGLGPEAFVRAVVSKCGAGPFLGMGGEPNEKCDGEEEDEGKMASHALSLIAAVVTGYPQVVKRGEERAHVISKLRASVVHRLGPGPLPHSSLAEAHSMLSCWDNHVLQGGGTAKNMLLSASGEGLDEVLDGVAERKEGEGLKPDVWRLKGSQWESWDPGWGWLSRKGHQTAVVARAAWLDKSQQVLPICPDVGGCHWGFEGTRQYLLASETLRSALRNTLNDHLLPSSQGRRSEARLSKAVHLITLGCHLWKDGGSEEFAGCFVEISSCEEWVDEMFLSGEVRAVAEAERNRSCALVSPLLTRH